jgi:hypothetical protein
MNLYIRLLKVLHLIGNRLDLDISSVLDRLYSQLDDHLGLLFI